jgi:hypothetical protein
MAWSEVLSGTVSGGAPDGDFPNGAAGPGCCKKKWHRASALAARPAGPAGAFGSAMARVPGRVDRRSHDERTAAVAAAGPAGWLRRSGPGLGRRRGGDGAGRPGPDRERAAGGEPARRAELGSQPDRPARPGQLHRGHRDAGRGHLSDRPFPVRVAGLSQVTAIAASSRTSYAISTFTGPASVWAWGDNTYGQLGDGTSGDIDSLPEHVTGIFAPVAAIAAGGGFAEILGTDGSVWGWGSNYDGELGTVPATKPVVRPEETIGPGSGITRLSAGGGHVLALKSDGTVLAWGTNYDGQLGDGSTGGSKPPQPVPGLAGVTQVAAGGAFSLAVYLPAENA